MEYLEYAGFREVQSFFTSFCTLHITAKHVLLDTGNKYYAFVPRRKTERDLRYESDIMEEGVKTADVTAEHCQ